MVNDPEQVELLSNFSADCVIFGFDLEKLNVLIIERAKVGDDDFKKSRALPGDLIRKNEAVDAAAVRILKELTGLSDIYMEQVGAFGDPSRLSKESDRAWLRTLRKEPDARVITIGYYSLVSMIEYAPKPSSFAEAAEWLPLSDVDELAFDHLEILNDALSKLRGRIRTEPIGFNLLPPKFTLSQLNKLYEAILDRPLDKRNFRRKILKLNILTPLNEKQSGVAHKPSQLFEFNQDKYNELVRTGFDNFGF